MTSEHNGVIITLYSCADTSPSRAFMFPACAKLCGLCL
nr:MAG TPA: Matrix metalloproteinase-23, metalloprotease, MMP23, potassium channel [Caudoviricetes sp.]